MHLYNELKKQILRHIMYFKVELKHITNKLSNNHNEILERIQFIKNYLEGNSKFDEKVNLDISCMLDCSLLIDNDLDHNTLEDKRLDNRVFKYILEDSTFKLFVMQSKQIFYSDFIYM